MMKERVLDKYGLGLTILDRVVCCSGVGIKITTTRNNIGNITVVVSDET